MEVFLIAGSDFSSLLSSPSSSFSSLKLANFTHCAVLDLGFYPSFN